MHVYSLLQKQLHRINTKEVQWPTMVLLRSQITVMFHLLFCIILFCGFKFLTMSIYQYNDQENKLLMHICLQDVCVLQNIYSYIHIYILLIFIHPSFPPSFCLFLSVQKIQTHTHTHKDVHTHAMAAVLAYPRDFSSWLQNWNVFYHHL